MKQLFCAMSLIMVTVCYGQERGCCHDQECEQCWVFPEIYPHCCYYYDIERDQEAVWPSRRTDTFYDYFTR